MLKGGGGFAVEIRGIKRGLALILAALCLRLAPQGEPVAPTQVKAALALGTGSFYLSDPEPTVWVLRLREEQAPEPVEKSPVFPSFSPADGETVTVGGQCSYAVDKVSLLQKKLSLSPTVLIVHTHTSEAYTRSAGFFYEETDPLRTLEGEKNVLRVGREVAEVLRSRGVTVFHDESYNDYPDYNTSYATAGSKIQSWLQKEPSISVVLDIHRDALEDGRGIPLHTTCALPTGEAGARLMLVVGTDEGGLSHPTWQENLSLALKLQVLLERETAGLCRDIDLRKERFNQHLTAGSLLVEVGATGNTLPEALSSAKLLGEKLADLLVGVS